MGYAYSRGYIYSNSKVDKGIFSRLLGLWHLIDLNLAHRTATVEEEELFFAENGQVDESQETSSVVLQVDY